MLLGGCYTWQSEQGEDVLEAVVWREELGFAAPCRHWLREERSPLIHGVARTVQSGREVVGEEDGILHGTSSGSVCVVVVWAALC